MRTLAIIYGLFYIIVGILGFIPSFSPQGMLFDAFYVNAANNIIYIITGIIGILTGIANFYSAMLFMRIMGIVYIIWAIIGFSVGHDYVFGFIANNLADDWANLILGIIALYLGFAIRRRTAVKAETKIDTKEEMK